MKTNLRKRSRSACPPLELFADRLKCRGHTSLLLSTLAIVCPLSPGTLSVQSTRKTWLSCPQAHSWMPKSMTGVGIGRMSRRPLWHMPHLQHISRSYAKLGRGSRLVKVMARRRTTRSSMLHLSRRRESSGLFTQIRGGRSFSRLNMFPCPVLANPGAAPILASTHLVSVISCSSPSCCEPSSTAASSTHPRCSMSASRKPSSAWTCSARPSPEWARPLSLCSRPCIS